VIIAVLTFRRPEDLTAVLPLLHGQLVENLVPTDPPTGEDGVGAASRILVVDNDPEASARSVCAELDIPRLIYVHEPRPGIAAARNRALTEAAGHDLMIFIDDDERPVPGWLTLLLETHHRERRCGVVGPVVSEFAVPLPDWVAAGGFFTRRRMPTGTPVTVAATNNLLLDLSRIRRAGVRFDDRFGISGGSDTLFTRQLVAAEGPLVWCDEAVVTDVVPASRCTKDWVLRRALRMGNSWSLTAIDLADSGPRRVSTRIALTASGTARILAGLGRSVIGLLTRDLGRRAGGTRMLARGTGMVLGAYGYSYQEYRRSRKRL
jgi:glycosyltransferase involved in cell wall biosynthesis